MTAESQHYWYKRFKLTLRELHPEMTRDEGLELYQALTNTNWSHEQFAPGEEAIGFSFRGAGGLVADLRDEGEDYMDFYCGAREGVVSERLRKELKDKGWTPKAL